jgi:hypothetical protein
MEAKFCKSDPSRPPRWRAYRAVQLTDRTPYPKPASSDDRYVRTYRRLLIAKRAAGGDRVEDFSVFCDMPHIYRAQQFCFCEDASLPRLLEAWLLTGEASADTAARFKTKEQVIDLYEKVFFDVRDRLDRKDWIALIIYNPDQGLCPARDGRMSDDQRAFTHRLFGYFGGPLALEGLIEGAAPDALPPNSAAIPNWFETVLAGIAQSRSKAVPILMNHRADILELLKKALPLPRRSRSRSASALTG